MPQKCTKGTESSVVSQFGFLCATSVSSVSLWLTNSWQILTTETQRTQRLHREEAQTKTLPKEDLNCAVLVKFLEMRDDCAFGHAVSLWRNVGVDVRNDVLRIGYAGAVSIQDVSF